MAIKGVEGLSGAEIRRELERGARFVVFQYCISVIVLTFKRGSGVYFVRADENAVAKGLPYTLLSLVLGWWGIPWGPIYTIQSLVVNFQGGKDVTGQVLATITGQKQAQ
ncbi:MAG: hypothetical protein JW900_03910 [Anaerolineae bacterium]|nr:hypothetical protein [Anaerolineae bacterium]